MGSNLANLEPWQAHQKMEMGVVGQSLETTIQLYQKKQIFSQIEIFSADEFRLCPEVRVCGFGSSPRFGDELMEIGVAAGRSVALGGVVWCGMGVWVVWYMSIVVHAQCGVGWKLVDSLHNSTP